MFADLHVVTVISNPERYESRYRLYKNFEKYVTDSGAKLYTVEAAFGERPHVITEANNPRHIQLRTSSQLWHKENMINIGIQRLPADWKYVAWIDADVQFARPDWVHETLHQLQHFSVVQLFSQSMDLHPDCSPASTFYSAGSKPASWGYCHVHDIPRVNTDLKQSVQTNRMAGVIVPHIDCVDGYTYKVEGSKWYWHPGFAWAARREAIDGLGGLIDWNIVGAGDYIMAASLTGTLTLPDCINANYRRWILEWRNRADRYVRGNVGYVPGLLLHHFHGAKVNRRYNDRWKILRDSEFDPELDLKKDWQGLWQLTDRKPRLRDDLRLYFRSRLEDNLCTDH